METASETPESTKSESRINIDELDVHRFSRWQDTDGRLFVVYGFGYGADPAKPMAGSWLKTDVQLLDVHSEKLNEIAYARFLLYVIKGMLLPWREVVQTIEPAFSSRIQSIF